MKRIGLNLLLLFLAPAVHAQETGYRKPVVVVNYFNYSSDFSKSDCELARSAVLASLSAVPRVRVVDVDTEASIDEETRRRLKETALADELARNGRMKQLGADYLLEGNVSKMEVERKDDSKGNTTFYGKVTYTIKVISTENGTTAFTNNYTTSSGSCKTTEEARNDALKEAAVGCGLIESVFPLKGTLIELDYTEKKEKLKTCYVSLGSIHGAEKGMYLDVKSVVNKAGREVYEDVGVLRIEQVLAGDLSECSVARNGKELLTAVRQYCAKKASDEKNARPLLVRSRCDTGNIFKDAGDAIKGLFK